MRILLLAIGLVLATSTVWSQQLSEALLQESGSMGEGWKGFTDIAFLANALATLTLAAVLGALIAYHPKHVRAADTLAEIEAPKVFITYSVIGALIGIMVVKYGLVVGFVLFGIGGLIRFRTVLRSASLTGHVIFVTLIGLSCGLDLPHVAVLATVFGFVLIHILNIRTTYRISVRALPPDRLVEAAAAYRLVLEQQGCNIMKEKKNPEKARFYFIFRGGQEITMKQLEESLGVGIDDSLKGFHDWEVD